jgi:hypothetical protein
MTYKEAAHKPFEVPKFEKKGLLKTTKGKLIAGGITATIVLGGTGIYASSQRSENEPTPTKPGIIIAEPSLTPEPIKTESPSINISPIPTKQPETTPSPKAEIKKLEDIKYEKTSPKAVSTLLDSIYENHPEYNDTEVFTKEFMVTLWKKCQSESDKNTKQAASDMLIYCSDFIIGTYTRYKETENEEFYTLSVKEYNYLLTEIGMDYKSQLDEILKQDLS